MSEHTGDGSISVGNVSGQGIAIGGHARASVVASSIGAPEFDAGELRVLLEQLYDDLDEAGLSRATVRSAQTATGNALQVASDDQAPPEAIARQIESIGSTLTQANVAIQQGSTLWQTVTKLAPLVGPLVGGAHIVAGWFGVPF